MRKKFLTFVALISAMFCIFGSVACNKENEAVAEVTVERWEELLSNTNNFSIDLTVNGQYEFTVLIDGAKRSRLNSTKNIEIIYDKIGENYYEYFKDNGVWTRSVSDAVIYEKNDRFAMMLFYFKEDYSLFEYENGKYYNKEIDKSETFGANFKKVNFEFKNGNLESFTCEAQLGNEAFVYKVKAINSTVVTIPENFTENK